MAPNPMDQSYKRILDFIKPALEASMDPVAIVNLKGEIIWVNLPMKSLLKVRGRDLKSKRLVFCDLIKLSCCKERCQIDQVLKTGITVRLDEVPALQTSKKMRMMLKVTPLFDPEAPKGQMPAGAIVSARDTTGEVLLQAKYHKLIQLVRERDQVIESMEERVMELQIAMRKARENSAA